MGSLACGLADLVSNCEVNRSIVEGRYQCLGVVEAHSELLNLYGDFGVLESAAMRLAAHSEVLKSLSMMWP